MTRAAQQKPAYHRGNVAQDLKETAVRILETERLEDISARRLCREVGVTSANFYNHFPSLEHFLLELAADGFEKRVVQNRRILGRDVLREEKLIELSVNLTEFAVEHAQLFRIMFGHVDGLAMHERYRVMADESFRIIVEAVYGYDRYRSDDIEWSRENCPHAYGFFAHIYGIARMISGKLMPVPAKAARKRFVTSVTQAFLRGLPN
jgi:AcrR family transcriptional regulator